MILTTISAKTSTGSQAYSIGAQPKAILIWTDGQASSGLSDGYRYLNGMSDGVLQVCRSVAMTDGDATPQGVQVDAPDVIYRMCSPVSSGLGTITQEASLTSFDASGFTLNWTVANGEATKIHVLAFTEDEVDNAKLVKVFCDSDPEVIPGIGFTPKLVVTIGGTTTTLAANRSGPWCAMPAFGFSDGISNVCHEGYGRLSTNLNPVCKFWGPAGATTQASTVIRYISSVFQGFAAVGESTVNFVPDGFDASKGGFGSTSLYHYFLALSTPLLVKVGTAIQPASGSVELDLDFDPSALILGMCGDGSSASQLSGSSNYALGAWLLDGTTRSAFSGCHRVSSVTHTARNNAASGALKFFSVDPTGSSSTLVADVDVIDDGHSLDFTTSDGTARVVTWVALGIPPEEEEVNRCEGGTVPQVPDPPDGYSPEGLGPHQDRFFIETDLDTGRQNWSLHDPMNDAPDLEAHAGRKDGRIQQVGSIVRRTTDRLGGWQASGARWSAVDGDRRIRELIATNQWFNREFRPYITDREDVANARCLGRFIIRDYPPQPGLTVDVDGVDIIITEFSPFNLDRDILSSVVFNRTFFPALPDALGDLDPPQPVPVYGGRWSDEGSADGTAPVMQGVAWRGATVVDVNTPSAYWAMGYHEMPVGGPPPPDTVAVSAIAGGNINLGDTAYNQLYVCVWGVTAGVEGDPLPFYADGTALVTITANGSKVHVSWTYGGADPDYWRIGLAPRYYGARWQQNLQVVGSARSCDFTDVVRFNLSGQITPGATPSYMNRGEYVVVAVMPDGFTPASSPFVIMTTGPYARPGHISWIPVAGASSYNVYKAYVPHQYFGIREKFSVPADQIDSDGLAYFVDDWTPGEAVTEIDAPRGMLPVWDCGDELLTDGQAWGVLTLCRWPVAEIEGIIQGADDITEHAEILHPDHPNWSTYFANRYVTKSGVDFTIIYARGSVLARHRAALGGETTEVSDPAKIQVNACTTEDIGNGLGNVITIGPRLAQHMLAELIRNDHLTGLWNGIPAFPDGVYEIRTSSYLQAEEKEIERVGEGYPSRMAFMEPTTVREFFELCAQGLLLHHGIDHHGRVRCGHYDDAIDLSKTYRSFTDIREITGNIKIVPRTQEIENRIPYVADFRPVDNAYALRQVYVEDAEAIASNRGKIKAGPERQTQFAASVLTWNDVMNRTLMLGRFVRYWVEVPTSIIGLNVDIFDVIRVYDEEGIGESCFTGDYVLVLEHEIIPPDPTQDRPIQVILKGLNITSLVEAAWVWAPDIAAPTWDLMSTEAKSTYGAWASPDGTIPTDGSAGKEWR